MCARLRPGAEGIETYSLRRIVSLARCKVRDSAPVLRGLKRLGYGIYVGICNQVRDSAPVLRGLKPTPPLIFPSITASRARLRPGAEGIETQV